MRVITGSARGRVLREVPGLQTRPTAAKVKEAIFSTVQFEVPDARVLDLFAGTGQMGIEALSRGARYCDFVDESRAAYEVLRHNIHSVHFEDSSALHQEEAIDFLHRARDKYNIIFLDPPYNTDLLVKALHTIAAIDICHENAIIICESSADKELPSLDAPYVREKEYRYGKTKITRYRKLAE